jgi:hypothetical protein
VGPSLHPQFLVLVVVEEVQQMVVAGVVEKVPEVALVLLEDHQEGQQACL